MNDTVLHHRQRTRGAGHRRRSGDGWTWPDFAAGQPSRRFRGRWRTAPAQLLVDPRSRDLNFATPGDSGAALVDEQGRVVGSNANGQGVYVSRKVPACDLAPGTTVPRSLFGLRTDVIGAQTGRPAAKDPYIAGIQIEAKIPGGFLKEGPRLVYRSSRARPLVE
jgi:hypothetical protein